MLLRSNLSTSLRLALINLGNTTHTYTRTCTQRVRLFRDGNRWRWLASLLQTSLGIDDLRMMTWDQRKPGAPWHWECNLERKRMTRNARGRMRTSSIHRLDQCLSTFFCFLVFSLARLLNLIGLLRFPPGKEESPKTYFFLYDLENWVHSLDTLIESQGKRKIKYRKEGK